MDGWRCNGLRDNIIRNIGDRGCKEDRNTMKDIFTDVL